jgi:hypothetical protein
VREICAIQGSNEGTGSRNGQVLAGDVARYRSRLRPGGNRKKLAYGLPNDLPATPLPVAQPLNVQTPGASSVIAVGPKFALFHRGIWRKQEAWRVKEGLSCVRSDAIIRSRMSRTAGAAAKIIPPMLPSLFSLAKLLWYSLRILREPRSDRKLVDDAKLETSIRATTNHLAPISASVSGQMLPAC